MEEGLSAVSSQVESADSLKAKGNEYFVKKDYALAESFYSEAIKLCDNNSILYANRSAANLELGHYSLALDDSEKAIQLNPGFVKAYFRKYLAMQKLGRSHKDCYDVWRQAARGCEITVDMAKLHKEALKTWKNHMKTEAIVDSIDFIERYQLLKDKRERLSTMAHLWNESTIDERHHHFQFLISLIGGQGEQSEDNKSLSPEYMMAMPLHNYEDLPRLHIEGWCNWFHHLGVEEKTQVFESIWNVLTSEEQNDVVADLRVFISQAFIMKNYDLHGGDDDEDLTNGISDADHDNNPSNENEGKIETDPLTVSMNDLGLQSTSETATATSTTTPSTSEINKKE